MSNSVVLGNATLYCGDCLETLRTIPDVSVQCCVTSPPYFGLRDYGHADQIGLEQSPDEYVAKLVAVFREVRRVLKDDGTLWLNIGDSYNAHPGQRKTSDKAGGKQQSLRGSTDAPSRYVDGLKPKDLIGIPWRVAFALQADGWWLRQDCIWHKPNPMPESVRDRCTKAHEYLFLLSKADRYYFDAEAISEPSVDPSRAGKLERSFSTSNAISTLRNDTGRAVMRTETRNRRSVWTIATKPFTGDCKTSHRVDVELGAVSCGTKRIAVSSCPVHGLLDHPGSIHECGAHEADDLNRTARIYSHKVQAQLSDVLAVDANDGMYCQADIQDCPSLAYVQTATDRNTQNHKMDPYPETSQPCKPCVETTYRTDDIQGQRDYVAPGRCIHASNTSISDEAACRLPDQTADDNSYIHASETPVCTCRFFNEVTKNISHFAVMPPALVEPCILAGSRPGDVVLDPFSGSGTTAAVAVILGRQAIGIELNADYQTLAVNRITAAQTQTDLFRQAA